MPLTPESAARKDRTTAQGAELQHRHFAFIAAVLADCQDLANVGAIARRFADACARSNHRFDRRRFMAACGLKD
jgi:hypothetical protein